MPRPGAASDPFRKMLVWSFVIHFLAFTTFALGGWLMPPASLPPPDASFVSLAASGPLGGGGTGSPAPTKPPEPEPPPEPEEREPEVVRPTVEQRDEVPTPDAPVKRKDPFPKPDEPSGITGQDASPKESDVLQNQTPGPPGISPGGGAGGANIFDQPFEYAYYVKTMLGRIHQHWQRTAVRGTAVVVVQFTIMKDGSVRDAAIEQSSGVSILDRGSLRAIMLSDPMPPLPNSYPNDRVGVHLRFTYSDNY